MSGWLNKLRSKLSPDHADKVADAVEDNVTDERVDSFLERAPGGQSLADKVPDDVGSQTGDAIRSNLGTKKAEP